MAVLHPSVLLNIATQAKTGGDFFHSPHRHTAVKHVRGFQAEARFTRKGNTLCAIALEWPEEELRPTSLAGKQVTKVDLLGLDRPEGPSSTGCVPVRRP